MHDFKRALDLNCKQNKNWTTFIFSIGFQMLKLITFKWGSEHVQNVIQ